MSRSLHTQKLTIRARRRLCRPFSKRSNEGHIISGKEEPSEVSPSRKIRIESQRPLPGTVHALSRKEISAFLEMLGPTAEYGLRTIRLRQSPALSRNGLVFAEYVIPGEIHLYSVPENPWCLPFLLSADDRVGFEQYGAVIEEEVNTENTTVYWLDDDLSTYILIEVLAHEIGHHLLQHHKGKRSVIISRRRDHENRAILQSHRAGKVLSQVTPPR